MERTLYDWAAEAAAALGIPRDARGLAEPGAIREVLDLAAELAHGVTRPAAPVGAFLAGVAIGLGDPSRPDAIARAREAIRSANGAASGVPAGAHGGAEAG